MCCRLKLLELTVLLFDSSLFVIVFYRSLLLSISFHFFLVQFIGISVPCRNGLVWAFEEPEWTVIICTGLCVMVAQAAWLQSEQRDPLVLDCGCVCVCLRVRQYVCVSGSCSLFPSPGPCWPELRPDQYGCINTPGCRHFVQHQEHHCFTRLCDFSDKCHCF